MDQLVHAVDQCLRLKPTSKKEAGSIHDGVNEIFPWYNPSFRTMALEFTQTLTEINTRGFPGDEAGCFDGLTSQALYVEGRKIWMS